VVYPHPRDTAQQPNFQGKLWSSFFCRTCFQAREERLHADTTPNTCQSRTAFLCKADRLRYAHRYPDETSPGRIRLPDGCLKIHWRSNQSNTNRHQRNVTITRPAATKEAGEAISYHPNQLTNQAISTIVKRTVPNLNRIERLWRQLKKSVTHNQSYEHLSDFYDSVISFFDLTSKQQQDLKKLLPPNFRIIDVSC